MRKCAREDAIEDRLQKLVVIGIEIAILTMICVSLFSGGPAFKTGATTPSRASVGLKSLDRAFADLAWRGELR
jgi:hypothetical protein